MSNPAIVVEALHVLRGRRLVLGGLDCRIERGAVTGLLGPSGCGKTTLIRALVGVQRVQSGSIRILGLHAGNEELRRRVGYMTQTPSVYGDLSVLENLRYFADVLDARRREKDAIRIVGLDGYEKALVRDLSGGERSRVSLAVALLGEPDVLVLDEPTVGLDPLLRQELWSTFHRLTGNGTTLLVSTHVMDEAERCDRILLMREGRILAEGTPAELQRETDTASIEAAFLALAGAA